MWAARDVAKEKLPTDDDDKKRPSRLFRFMLKYIELFSMTLFHVDVNVCFSLTRCT